MPCPERHLPGRIQKKLLLLIAVLIAVFLVGAILPNTRIHADEVQDLQKQIDDLEHLRQLSEAATAPLEQEVASLDQKIANARAGIVRAKQESEKLAAEIAEREKELDYQYVVLSKRIAEQYKKARTFSPLLMILSSTDAKELTKDLAYRSSVKAQDNRMIHTLGADIANLQTDKKKHEENQIALARLEQQLDEQADFFKGEIERPRLPTDLLRLPNFQPGSRRLLIREAVVLLLL